MKKLLATLIALTLLFGSASFSGALSAFAAPETRALYEDGDVFIWLKRYSNGYYEMTGEAKYTTVTSVTLKGTDLGIGGGTYQFKNISFENSPTYSFDSTEAQRLKLDKFFAKESAEPFIKNTARYSDVPDAYWGATAIYYVTDKGLFKGVGNGKFMPEKTITRAEFAVVLRRISQTESLVFANPQTKFTDVASSDWFCNDLMWSYDNGFTRQANPTSRQIEPHRGLTRQEMAFGLGKYLNDMTDATFTTHPYLNFSDQQTIANWALPQVRFLVENQIVNGMANGTFSPNTVLTRAQIAQIIYNMNSVKQSGQLRARANFPSDASSQSAAASQSDRPNANTTTSNGTKPVANPVNTSANQQPTSPIATSTTGGGNTDSGNDNTGGGNVTGSPLNNVTTISEAERLAAANSEVSIKESAVEAPVIYKTDSNLPFNERETRQQGQNGTALTLTWKKNGQVLDTATIDKTAAVPQVVFVGNIKTHTEVIPFETGIKHVDKKKVVVNPFSDPSPDAIGMWPAFIDEKIKDAEPGENGEKEIIETYQLDENGNLVNPITSENIIKPAVDAVEIWGNFYRPGTYDPVLKYTPDYKLDEAEKLLDLIDEFRAKNGKPPVMRFEKHFKEHLIAASRSAMLLDYDEFAHGHGYDFNITIAASPEEALEHWKNSPGHRGNLLGDRAASIPISVGVFRMADDWAYYTIGECTLTGYVKTDPNDAPYDEDTILKTKYENGESLPKVFYMDFVESEGLTEQDILDKFADQLKD